MVQDESLRAWMALSFTPRLGMKNLSRLLSHDAPEKLLSYTSIQWQALGLKDDQIRYLQSQAIREAELCLEWQQADALRTILIPQHPLYPPLLKEIASAPPVLFVEGDVQCLSLPQIAIVGSRNATIDGQRAAHQFARELVEQGMVITSGLALGIDGYAHDGALTVQGKTIAVLGSGFDHLYPARHRQLAERIRHSGALVSEFRPDTKPRAEHFPRRNRIVSGLSLGVLVVEAALKSGSLITARYATEQDREVFVLPGTIYQSNYAGSNELIRQGACLVQNVAQILEELGVMLDWSINQQNLAQPTLFSPLNDEEQLPFPLLLANVGVEATPVDILASRTNIPVQDVMTQLLELELSGHVVAVSGGYIRKGRG